MQVKGFEVLSRVGSMSTSKYSSNERDSDSDEGHSVWNELIDGCPQLVVSDVQPLCAGSSDHGKRDEIIEWMKTE